MLEHIVLIIISVSNRLEQEKAALQNVKHQTSFMFIFLYYIINCVMQFVLTVSLFLFIRIFTKTVVSSEWLKWRGSQIQKTRFLAQYLLEKVVSTEPIIITAPKENWWSKNGTQQLVKIPHRGQNINKRPSQVLQKEIVYLKCKGATSRRQHHNIGKTSPAMNL